MSPDGTAQVQGSRTINVQGKNESITISGSVPPRLHAQKGAINFSQLANARLAYTTLISSATNVLSPSDIQTITTPAPAAATAAAPAAGAAAATAATTAAPQTTQTISDARKKELLLVYLNRLLDVVFSQ